MGKREELSSAKAEKLKRGGVPRRDKKSSVCYEHSEGHLETEEARDKEPQPPTLAVKALGEFVPFVTPFRKLES